MMHAYELTGDRKFLEIAHMGFSYAVKRSGGAGKGGSVQLTITPHTVYNLKQAGITSLDTVQWEASVRLQAGFVPVEPGAPIGVPVTVTSNRDQAQSVVLRVEGVPDGWTVPEPRAVELAQGAEEKIVLSFPDAPGLQRGQTVALSVVAEVRGAEPVRRQVVLGCPAEGMIGGAAGLVAGADDYLGPALQQAGIDAEAIDSLQDLSDFGVIFLGTQAHTVDAAGLQRDYAYLLQWVQSGGTLVISQLNDDNWRPEFLPGSVVLDEANALSGKIAAPDHPIFTTPTRLTDVSGMAMYDSIAEAEGWQVLLEDASGRPAIIATNLGSGRILAVMPSVERYYTGTETCTDPERMADYQALFGNIIIWAMTGNG